MPGGTYLEHNPLGFELGIGFLIVDMQVPDAILKGEAEVGVARAQGRLGMKGQAGGGRRKRRTGKRKEAEVHDRLRFEQKVQVRG
ncbi:MAG: hypothetical protein H7A47_08415 [Verrucomicrobiales bacterium]|nr:hypothetical protein [Verrucomicrobiales bacterium]